jgi:plasmid stability protein
MATLTVRNLPDDVRDALRHEAAAKQRSMEEEARQALTERYRRKKLSPADVSALFANLREGMSPLPDGAKMGFVDQYLCGKRLDALTEDGLLTQEERDHWQELIDAFQTTLEEVDAFARGRRQGA